MTTARRSKNWVLSGGYVTYTPGEVFEFADEDSSIMLRIYDERAPDLLALCVTDENQYAVAVLPRPLMAMLLQVMLRFAQTEPAKAETKES